MTNIAVKETNKEIKVVATKINSSQPKIVACQTSKGELAAKLDDGRKVSISLNLLNKWVFGKKDINSEQLKNYEIWNEGSNIYFPDIDEILPVRILSKGLFSSCNEDME